MYFVRFIGLPLENALMKFLFYFVYSLNRLARIL